MKKKKKQFLAGEYFWVFTFLYHLLFKSDLGYDRLGPGFITLLSSYM